MKNVVLKPELRTPGGETVSIYCDGDWAGDLYLVYREGDVLTGTIQIDTSKVEEHELEAVTEEVRTYVEHLNSALGVEESSVVMMYGDISAVVEMEPFDAVQDDEIEMLADDEAIYSDDDVYDDNEVYVDAFDDEADDEAYEFDGDEIITGETIIDEDEEEDFHLSVIYKKGEHTKYHLHNDDHQPVGVISVDEIENNVSGRVEFWDEPDDDETNEVARMLARTFSDGGTERISFTMNYGDEHLGDMHLERSSF